MKSRAAALSGQWSTGIQVIQAQVNETRELTAWREISLASKEANTPR
jgi:hypothetical protein